MLLPLAVHCDDHCRRFPAAVLSSPGAARRGPPRRLVRRDEMIEGSPERRLSGVPAAVLEEVLLAVLLLRADRSAPRRGRRRGGRHENRGGARSIPPRWPTRFTSSLLDGRAHNVRSQKHGDLLSGLRRLRRSCFHPKRPQSTHREDGRSRNPVRKDACLPSGGGLWRVEVVGRPAPSRTGPFALPRAAKARSAAG